MPNYTSTIWNIPVEDIFGVDVADDVSTMVYTKVIMEIPEALDALLSPKGNSYWTSPSAMKTKKFISTMFKTDVAFIRSSLVVHFGNRTLVEDINNPGSIVKVHDVDRFSVNMSTFADDYLFVEYYPASLSHLVGDMRTYFTSKGIISSVVSPKIDYRTIVTARDSVNRLERYLELVPTLWTGDNNNTTGEPSNIIPDITPIYWYHIKELQDKLQAVSDVIYDGSVAPGISFTDTISEDSVLDILYINEITQAIQILEQELG